MTGCRDTDMANLFAPRDTLIRHLRLLIDSNTLRSVESANEFADLLDGKLPFVHRAAYVVYDKYSNVSVQGRTQKMTQHYTVYLVMRHARRAEPDMEAGTVLAALMAHVEGLAVSDGDTHTTPGYGKRFTLGTADNAFYRPDGWGFYPVSFTIDIINLRSS